MDVPLALREFLEYVIGSLIEHRDDVSIAQTLEGNRLTFDVRLHPDDLGTVVGRSGHTVKAMRNLMAAAALHDDLKVALRVDPREGSGGAPEPAVELPA